MLKLRFFVTESSNIFSSELVGKNSKTKYTRYAVVHLQSSVWIITFIFQHELWFPMSDKDLTTAFYVFLFKRCYLFGGVSL